MKQFKHYWVIALFFSVVFSFCYAQNTHAISISSAWLTGYRYDYNYWYDYDGYLHFDTDFGVGISFSDCSTCEVAGVFTCISPGAPYTTGITGWSGPSYSYSSDGWDYYRVILYGYSGEQTIAGYIRNRPWGYLYAYAMDQNGNILNGGNYIDRDWAYYGDEAKVSRHNYNPAGYTPTNWWRWYDNENNWSEEDPFISHTMNRHKNAYVLYYENIAQGKSDAGDKTTDWQNSDKTADTYHLNSCSPTSGCQVTFKHSLRRTSGTGSTSYTVTRESNYWNSTRTLSGAESKTLASGTETFSSGNNQEIEKYRETLTLVPGQVVCEKLSFGSRPGDSSKSATTTACAAAHGNAQPADPSNPNNPESPSSTPEAGNSAFLNIKVRNNTLGTNYQKSVYAKPTDTLTYRATYNPILQYTYDLKPQAIRIRSGGVINGTGSIFGTLFNNNNNCNDTNKQNCWNNAFSVFKNNFSTNDALPYSFTLGDTTIQYPTNTYEIPLGLTGGTGSELKETAKTNSRNNDKTTPTQITFSDNNGANTGNVATDIIESSAGAKVPYNFTLTTDLSDKNNGKVIYAGEEISNGFIMNITIHPRSNSLTTKNNEQYATSVKSGQYKFKYCIGHFSGKTCTGTPYNPDNSTNTTFSESISTKDHMNNGKTTPDKTSSRIIIPDLPAGTDFCVVSMVYPKDSGPNDNLRTDYYDSNNEANWSVSGEQCFDVAKKPSLEIWGGNIYANGTINTAVSTKVQLDGHPDQTYVFGSWGELGVIASTEVRGLSSGAGTGYDGLNLNHTPGGLAITSTSNNFCERSTLSFANNGCNNNGPVGTLSGIATNNSALNIVNQNKESIKNKFGFKGIANVVENEEIALNEDDKINASNVYYYYGDKSFEIPSNTINASTIQVVDSDQTITITGDITYQDTSYTLLRNGQKEGTFLPKLVIMAKNINIECGVDQIDGVLIADESIKTCSDSTDINARINSNPLKINGTIITSKLIPNRTYGAASGNNSMISAETINFDPSLYFWGDLGSVNNDEDDEGTGSNDNGGSGGKTDELNITYNKETSPRL